MIVTAENTNRVPNKISTFIPIDLNEKMIIDKDVIPERY